MEMTTTRKELKEYLIDEIDDYADYLIDIPAVRKMLERDIAVMDKLLQRL